MVGGPEQTERRRYPRHSVAEQATILVGQSAPVALVFGETLNWSRGGACLKAPTRFAIRLGELLNLASARIGRERVARVVGITEGGVHCAFEQDLAECV